MKVLVLLLFFWLGISFTCAIRTPRNCGNGGKLSITSLQPQGTNENQWAVGYHGNMFKAVVKYDNVYKIKWKVEYGDVIEIFEYTWFVLWYVASRTTKNGAFNALKPWYNAANRKAETTITLNSGKKVNQVTLTFSTVDQSNIKACSITNIVFKECEAIYPLTVNSLAKNYNSSGQFQCAKGYDWFPNPSSTSTKCMADATWKNAGVNKCRKKVCQALAPLMVNSLSSTSTYLSEGQFTCPDKYDLFPFNSNTTTKCLHNGKWQNSDNFKCYEECRTQGQLFVNSTSSKYSSIGHFYCEDGYHLFPVNQSIETTCTEDAKWYNQDDFNCFEECQTDYPLLVNSSSSTYSSEGNFYCDKGFDIFPINQNTSTTCSAYGKWINSHEFKCYRAPNDTRIVGNLMIKEHEKMEIYCKFTQTTPLASKSTISFGNQTFEISVNEPFIRNITIEDDGKMIWCQPISSYTKTPQFSKKGKSPERQLRVLFAPKSINHDSNLTCDWIIGNDGNSGDFTFLSRPSADNISLFLVKNESDVKVEFKFSNSSLGRNQTITITQIENNHLSSQRFRLQVISSLFPESLLTFPFHLNMNSNVYNGETQPKILKSSQVTIIIGTVAGAVVIILLISLVFVIKRRKMRNNNGALSNEAVAEDRINDIYETADDVRGGNSVREERCNVIYNSGFTGTKGESVREERCNIIYEGGDYGTEEKVNPLYGAALNQVPMKKTSNKNQHQATSNSYKQNHHSINESDHVYASVVESKTTKKKNKTSIQNHQNINDSEQTYASVDVTKKKIKELKHKTSPKNNQNLNGSALYASADLSQDEKTNLKRETTLQDHPSVTDSAELYSSIDISKKKANKNAPATSDSLNDSDQLYASVDVSKKTGNNLR